MKKSIISVLTALLVACTAGLVACGHECSFDQKVTGNDYLASAATCTAEATYYYSCTCGEKGTETFADGEKLAHTFDQEVVEADYLATAATCTAKATYFKSCVCGEKGTATFETGETLAHTFDQEVQDADYVATLGTCLVETIYFKSCTCGEKGTETFVGAKEACQELVEVVDEDYIAAEVSCTSPALYYKSCSLCGTADAVAVFADGQPLAHAYTVQDTKASAAVNGQVVTCEQDGLYFKSCEYCGTPSTDDADKFAVSALGHDYDVNTFICNNACGEALTVSKVRENDPTSIAMFDTVIGTTLIPMEGRVNVKSGTIAYDAAKNMTAVDIGNIGSSITTINIPVKSSNYPFSTEDVVEGEDIVKVINDTGYIMMDVLYVPAEGADIAQSFGLRGKSNAPCYATPVFANVRTTVLIPVKEVFVKDVLTFSIVGTANVDGTLYFGKGKYVAANKVIDIATTDTAYSFAGYNFVGGSYATTSNNVDFNYTAIGGINTGAIAWTNNSNVYSQVSDVTPHYVDGVIRFGMRADHAGKAGTGIGSALRIVLKLAQPATFTNGAITVIARGAAFTGQVYFRNSANSSMTGQKGMMVSEDQSGVPAGYVRYVMSTTFNSGWASDSFDTIIFDVTPTVEGIYTQGTISSIWFPNIVKN